MITLENEFLQVEIAKYGAEIKSVSEKQSGTEYIWQANPEYWGRSTPILFPFVGRLTDDKYLVDGVEYTQTQHGFARDNVFICTKQTEDTACFTLKATAETRAVYPFEFELIICYRLEGRRLDVVWQVNNNEDQVLPFSIGGHPAFNLNLFDALETTDYYVEFQNDVQLTRSLLSTDGTFSGEVVDMGINDSFRLTAEMFIDDALVLDMENMKTVAIKNMKNDKSVIMDLSTFTYKDEKTLLGIWSPYKDGGIAPFLCLEPWFGHADTVGGPFEISEKPGIITLEKGESFTTNYGLIFE